jgi:hypothetical protein
MNKWLGCLLVVITLAGFGQSTFAQDSFDNSFFKPIDIKPKTSPAPTSTPTPSPAKPTAPTVNPQSVAPSVEAQETNIFINSNRFTSYECAYWWQIALCFAITMVAFMIVTKKRPQHFKHLNGFSLLLIPIIGGMLSWQLHHYIHYDWKHYDNAFLCFNYWFVMGFEVFYFCMIFLLVYGFEGIKLPVVSPQKKKRKA